MTPVIKPGWDLYNCHPPPGKIRRLKRPKKGSSGSATIRPWGMFFFSKSLDRDGRISDGRSNSFARTRRCSVPVANCLAIDPENAFCRNPNPQLGAPLKAIHVKPILQGHYRLRSFSTDSLRMRNLDVLMQVIPEEDDVVPDNYGQAGIEDSELGRLVDDTEPRMLASGRVVENQDLNVPNSDTLFTRFRNIISRLRAALPAATPSRDRITTAIGPTRGTTERRDSLPKFAKNFYGRRNFGSSLISV